MKKTPGLKTMEKLGKKLSHQQLQNLRGGSWTFTCVCNSGIVVGFECDNMDECTKKAGGACNKSGTTVGCRNTTFGDVPE